MIPDYNTAMKCYYISTTYICNLINTLHNNVAILRGRYFKNYNSVVLSYFKDYWFQLFLIY